MPVNHAIVKQVQGITFVAKGNSSHWVAMDGHEMFGGSNAASSPKELLLFALGGCTASDVVPILKKKRAGVTSLEVRLTATARDEHPRVFTEIHIEYVVHGHNIRPADVERAIELSTTKYCSVSAMLRQSVRLTHSFRIVEPAQEEPAPEAVSRPD